MMLTHLLKKAFYLLPALTAFTFTLSDAAKCCADNMTFTFGSYLYSNQIITRNCAWIIDSHTKTETCQSKWCKEGSLVQNECPVACEVCDACPKDSCQDNPDYSFGTYDYKGEEITRTCAWFKENTVAEQRRKDKWCVRHVYGVLVQNQCPETCEKPSCGQCEDDSSFTYGGYTLNDKTVTRNCAWILENPDKIEVRKKNWCNRDYEDGPIVNSMCPFACGICVVSPDIPTLAPDTNTTSSGKGKGKGKGTRTLRKK
jgi:hypothetical protein